MFMQIWLDPPNPHRSHRPRPILKLQEDGDDDGFGGDVEDAYNGVPDDDEGPEDEDYDSDDEDEDED